MHCFEYMIFGFSIIGKFKDFSNNAKASDLSFKSKIEFFGQNYFF